MRLTLKPLIQIYLLFLIKTLEIQLFVAFCYSVIVEQTTNEESNLHRAPDQFLS